MYINFIEKGVCAPKGFQAAGIHCGLKKKKKKDLALIVSDTECSGAAVYTLNKVKSATILLTKENLKDGKARGIVCNSGNANTCAPNSMDIAKGVCQLVGDSLGIAKEDLIVCSTGVIGESLSLEPFERGIASAVKNLSYDGSEAAANAIMTTDTRIKEVAISFILGNKECHIGGIAKGSGMINPNMATLLGFVTTDVSISSEMLQRALSEDVKDTFNQVNVDGDTSTNDTIAILANGLAGNENIVSDGKDFQEFCEALNVVTSKLSRELAKDGEGASKLLECIVSGAPNKEVARAVSKKVIQSSLVKTAVFGEDANWGRIACAIGYTEGDFNVENIDIVISSSKGSVEVCKGTRAFPFSEERGKLVLSDNEVKILINLNQGDCSAIAFGCDLSYEYIKINGSYRS